jgi:lysozyme family protein
VRTVDQIIDEIIRRDGGYVDHANDRGGPTKYGITEAVARLHGWRGDMRDLPENLTRRIYLDQYYRRPGFDQIHTISPGTAPELTDTGVNMGPEVAVKFLQRALNALNQQERLLADLKADGYLGNKTLAALRTFLAHRSLEGETVLLKALNCLQGARYSELPEARPQNESFVYGWLRERVAI